MLKNKITPLCELKNISIKKLAYDVGFSEQSMHRWFKYDSMEIKHLRKIAKYFNKDISYFFCDETGNPEFSSELKEPQEQYINYKEKYISVLETNMELNKKIHDLQEDLSWYEANCECPKTKQKRKQA